MLKILKHCIERKNAGAVYEIPCLDCPGVYIGETGRCFSTRLKEHRCDLEPCYLAKFDDDNINKKFALVKHVIFNDHKIDWNNCKILCLEPDFSKNRFLKSFYIKQNAHAVNDKNNCFHLKVYDIIRFFIFCCLFPNKSRSVVFITCRISPTFRFEPSYNFFAFATVFLIKLLHVRLRQFCAILKFILSFDVLKLLF